METHVPVVLITTEPLQNVPGPHVDLLHQAGFKIRYRAQSTIHDDNDTADAVRGAQAVIAGSEPYTARVLEGRPELRVISRNGVGYDQVDVDAATRLGVAVTITPEGNHQAVAEHALALLLALARKVPQNDRLVRRGGWEREILTPLRGKTLGLVGLGRIGRSVALRAAAFRMRVVAYDPFPNETFARSHGIELVDLDSLLACSDFVSLHVPSSQETRGLIDRRTLAQMKPGSFLVNTARGALVVEEDLIEALRSGHLAGAGLDVLADEPPPASHPLFGLDNVILSPHAAACDAQAITDMAIGAARNIVELYQGNWPAGAVVNPAVKDRFVWGTNGRENHGG